MKITENSNGVELTYPNGWSLSLVWKRPNHYAGEGTIEAAIMANDEVVGPPEDATDDERWLIALNPEGWVPLMEVPILMEEVERLGPVPSDPRIVAQLAERAINKFHDRSEEYAR